MKRILLPLLMLGFVTAGCNNAKSPEAVAKDVGKAEEKAARELSNSEQSANKDLDKSAGAVDGKLTDFNNTAARDAYNLAIAKADGDRKVSLANCEAASGDAQKHCKDQADLDYNAAKADAKAAAQSVKQ